MSGIAAVSGASMGAAPVSAPAASAAGALGAGALGGASLSGGASGTSHISLSGSSSASSGASSSGSAGSLGGLDASQMGAANGAMSSTSVQTSSLIGQAQPNANIQNMAALMLSLLLSKSDDSKDKDDPWKMLAGMAMLGAMASQNQGVSMSQSTSVVSEAYSTGGTAAAATGGAVNVQG